MKAGAGKSEIILAEEYLEIEDFAVIHRTLNARAVVIQSGQTVVLLSLEITSMPDEETYAIRKKIAENYTVEEDHVWVCVTHTCSAPHLLPDFILKDPERIAEKAKMRPPAKCGQAQRKCEQYLDVLTVPLHSRNIPHEDQGFF